MLYPNSRVVLILMVIVICGLTFVSVVEIQKSWVIYEVKP